MSATVAVLAPGSANAAALVELPDVAFTATLDKTTYVLGDPFTLTLTYVNHGPVTAHNVHPTGSESNGLTFTTFPPAGPFDLAPAETVTRFASGTINSDGVNLGIAGISIGYASDEADANAGDNVSAAKAIVTGAFGSFTGVVFDEAGGVPPAAHIGVEGASIAIANALAPDVVVATALSNADGDFGFADVPVGLYQFHVTFPPGFALGATFPTGGAAVHKTGNPLVRISAVQVPIETPPAAPAAPAPALPVTGTPALRIGGIGLAVVAVGAVLVLVARRRRQAA